MGLCSSGFGEWEKGCQINLYLDRDFSVWVDIILMGKLRKDVLGREANTEAEQHMQKLKWHGIMNPLENRMILERIKKK